MDTIVWAVDAFAREAMLFAAVGFLIGGADELVVDALWFAHRSFRRRRPLAALPPRDVAPRFAIFVPAWREENVIAAMLGAALGRIDYPDYRIFVGCYPNDRATIDAVATVAERDARVRLVIGDQPGPTSKGANLNCLWAALRSVDAASARPTDAVVLHDAEDVVHPLELELFARLIGRYDAVQVPVVPLVDRTASLVCGHYADEFAEQHGRVLPVRVALGAGMPFAGVGCAIRVETLAALERSHGAPFDAESLTEDYELGLRISAAGGRCCFARRAAPDGGLIAVRAYFPAALGAAVVQKARWLRGIALAGWDRVGWGRALDLGEHWMRMRDRRAPLAVLVLAAAYLALIGWAAAAALHCMAGSAPAAVSPTMRTVLLVNLVLVGWRLALRIAFTWRSYGPRQALWAVPRAIVGNLIAILAVRRALFQYVRTPEGARPRWDKTVHVFPRDLAGIDAR